MFIALENENKDGEYIIKLEIAKKVNTESSSLFSSFQNSFTIQSYSYIYYSSHLLVGSSSLGPLDLEFEAVPFFIWAWLYLQRESVKWAETLAQDNRGVNVLVKV